MKNQKGITMISLTIYIVSFVLIIGIISAITMFFNKNIRELNNAEGISSEYNKFNLYMVKYTKSGYECEIKKEDDKLKYISFEKKDDNKIDYFSVQANILYFNQIKLCENVNGFDAKIDTAENGKDVLKTKIVIGDKEYSTDYVIE